MWIIHTFCLLLLWYGASGAARVPREDERGNLHPGRVILYRPVASNRHEHHVDRDAPSGYNPRYPWDRDRTPERRSFRHDEPNRSYPHEKSRDFPDRDEPYDRHKQPSDRYPSSSRERPSSYRPQRNRFDDEKLPASKYENDYFQPHRPANPEKPIQNRNGFLFPDEDSGRGTIWAPRGRTPYDNAVDYVPRERHRFLPTGSAQEYVQRPRPALLQANAGAGIPVQGAGVIVASGPGGVRHVIHDLRVPVHTHVHHGAEKPQATDPYRVVANHFQQPENDPYNNDNQGYKGVPVYLPGGNFGGKVYDPHFIELYRQVLEENQKKQNSDRKEKAGFPQNDNFQSSPPFQWFSEPDPLYHPRTTTLVAVPQLQLTTGALIPTELLPTVGTSFETPQHTQASSNEEEHSTVQVQSTTGPALEPQPPTSPFEPQPPTSPAESLPPQVLPPAVPESTETPLTTSPPPDTPPPSQGEASESKNTDTTSTGSEIPPSTEGMTGDGPENDTASPAPQEFEAEIYSLSLPYKPDESPPGVTERVEAATVEQPGAQLTPSGPDPVLISTSVSHSVSAIRPTREKSEGTTEAPESTPRATEAPAAAGEGEGASSVLEEAFTPAEEASTPAEETSTTAEIGETTNHVVGTDDAQLSPSNDAATTVSDDETTTERRETTIYTPAEQDPTIEGHTHPTTTVTEMALTTMNYLVMSLVNQVRVNQILSENSTSVPSTTAAT